MQIANTTQTPFQEWSMLEMFVFLFTMHTASAGYWNPGYCCYSHWHPNQHTDNRRQSIWPSHHTLVPTNRAGGAPSLQCTTPDDIPDCTFHKHSAKGIKIEALYWGGGGCFCCLHFYIVCYAVNILKLWWSTIFKWVTWKILQYGLTHVIGTYAISYTVHTNLHVIHWGVGGNHFIISQLFFFFFSSSYLTLWVTINFCSIHNTKLCLGHRWIDYSLFSTPTERKTVNLNNVQHLPLINIEAFFFLFLF